MSLELSDLNTVKKHFIYSLPGGCGTKLISNY